MLEEWLERHVDRRAARQRTQVDSAKLVATFAASLAAALIASALQVGKALGWDVAGSTLLGVAFLGVLIVVALDRTKEVDQEAILRYGDNHHWSGQQILEYLRFVVYISVKNNEAVVRSVKVATQLQVLVAAAASICGIVSLLQ